MTLLINACVRGNSRSRLLADYLLSKLGGPAEEVDLAGIHFPVADEAFLRRRDRLIAAGAFGDPLFRLAGQFARADRIVIAAPYWDLSFPAVLKQYFEQINVLGITFEYTPEGTPRGLCSAKKLYYVTTAGGAFVPEDFGFGYVKALAENFYGIPCVKQVMAKGLDIAGADEAGILREGRETIDRILEEESAEAG